jgi:hypothetical protein
MWSQDQQTKRRISLTFLFLLNHIYVLIMFNEITFMMANL